MGAGAAPGTLENESTGAASAHAALFHLERLDGRPDRLQLLNDGQRRAIALFLLYFAPDRYAGDDARNALQRFWSEYLPEKYRP